MRKRPSTEMSTVLPATSTLRPAVPTASTIAPCTSAPPSSPARKRVSTSSA